MVLTHTSNANKHPGLIALSPEGVKHKQVASTRQEKEAVKVAEAKKKQQAMLELAKMEVMHEEKL